MDIKKETDDEIGIRLNLSKKEDQPIFDYFLEIKEYLGVKTNTEAARICIKQAYEFWFKEKIKKT
ncbi:MAG: hypothetical protein ACFFAN_05215 [Promethearchaeota archaeon]